MRLNHAISATDVRLVHPPQEDQSGQARHRSGKGGPAVRRGTSPTLYWVEQHVDPSQKMQAENIVPEHARWKVGGPNGIQLKDLRLAALEQVSAGSYQPRLFYNPLI